MISRQRTNLNRTFALGAAPPVDSEAAKRIETAEQELLTATREFTEGLESRFGPIACLHVAQDAMRASLDELHQANVENASQDESIALQGLIKARQNLRQLLKQSSSSQASACRKFDREQKQKLRTQEQKKPAGEQLAREIEKLAQRERQFSKDMSRSPSEGSGASSSDSAPSDAQGEQASDLAEQQQQAAEQADKLNQRMAEDKSQSDLARSRMDKAAQTVRTSAESITSGETQQASQLAETAAEQLERLARQLDAASAKELAARLSQARAMAEQIAQEASSGAEETGSENSTAEGKSPGKSSTEGGTPGKQPGHQASELAEDARTLGELLRRLATDAQGENRQVGDAVTRAAKANSPDDLAERLDQAAEQYSGQQPRQAAESAQDAANIAKGLASDLDRAYRNLVQSNLEELLALEREAAKAQQALSSVRKPSQQGEVEQQLGELAGQAQSLTNASPKVQQAAASLADALATRGPGWSNPDAPNSDQQLPPGVYYPPRHWAQSLQKMLQELQSDIQQQILEQALVDRNGPVPSAYKELVEEYYRVLSEDLR